MSQQDELCSTCASQKAASFSCDDDRETLLCEKCFFNRSQISPSAAPSAVPMTEFRKYESMGYFDRLQARKARLPLVREELRKNIERVDKLIADVNRAVQTIITTTVDLHNSILQKLRAEKTVLEKYIDEAIAEFESTIEKDEPVLCKKLVKYLREPQGDISHCQCFTYSEVSPASVLSALESMCKFTVSIPRFRLPGVFRSTLWLYNLETGESQLSPLSKSFTKGLRVCFLDDSRILIVGSTPAMPQANIITTPDAVVTEIQPMHTPRRLPGLIAVGAFAYVFGGQCVQCERLDTAKLEWSSLPNLQVEPNPLSPVLKIDRIYLVSSTGPVEVFDLKSLTFHQIALDLKGIYSDMSCFGLSDEIVILTSRNQVGHWKYDTEEITVSQFVQKGENPVSQCPLVTCGGVAYFVSWRNASLNGFDLDSYVISKK